MTAIPSFQVCADVSLGPRLASMGEKEVEAKWVEIPKNKSSDDPTKTQPDPRFTKYRRTGDENKEVQEPCMKTQLEAVGGHLGDKNIVFGSFPSQNMLAKAVHVAFYEHYPLRLSPDVIWLTIIQGLAKHIDKDPKAHRSKFVDFDGKKKLVISRPEFVKGSKDNDWTTVFPEFAAKIAANIGDAKADTLTNNFSTSTLTDGICSNVALMDTVKHYFEYEMLCGCGIPSVELTGTAQDWMALRQKANLLDEFGLDWWTKELFPVLDQFVSAAKGSPNVKFWKSVCNLYGGSGSWSGFVTGWVQVFFPYLNDGNRSYALQGWRENFEKGTGKETELFNQKGRSAFVDRGWGGPRNVGIGLKLDMIPSGLSQAPFVYRDMSDGKSFDMTFNGGLVAVVQDKETLALEPMTGWAVLDHGVLGE